MPSSDNVDLQFLQRTIAGFVERHEARAFPPEGGGGSGGDGMDNRIARLEGQFDRLSEKMDRQGDRLGGVEKEMATLTERVAHLPSKGFIWTVALAIIAAISAVITFAEKLQGLVG